MSTTMPRTRFSIEDITDIQTDALSMPSKLDAVQHLAEHFDHLTPRFISRHLARLVSLDPWELMATIGYSDPTGEQAVRNVMKEAA